MRGRLASRAHSFKENFLNVFGHHSPQHDNSCNSSNSTANSTFDDTTGCPVNVGTSVAHAAVSTDGNNQARNGAAAKNHQDKLTKKTNSTDNIIDFVTTSTNTVADPRSTEVRVSTFD